MADAKLLPATTAADPDALERFTREARAVAALNHPHIVTIYSTEEADGIRFMTMELIEGRPLDALIPEKGVSLTQFFDISMALADALAAAHEKHITHRDLKPGNVMVTVAGRVKVLDFGLARSSAGPAGGADDATYLALTQAGTVLGTTAYMSPEQIEGQPLDGAVRLFARQPPRRSALAAVPAAEWQGAGAACRRQVQRNAAEGGVVRWP